jgi:DNA adenine methylase
LAARVVVAAAARSQTDHLADRAADRGADRAGGQTLAQAIASPASPAPPVSHDAPKIGALAPWFGGKRALASAIVAQVCWDPRANGGAGGERAPAYFAEPFCGSMAVSLAMPDVATHLVSDLHRGLINFATVLADASLGRELIGLCDRTLCCETLYQDAAAFNAECSRVMDVEGGPVTIGSLRPLEWAHAFFVASWLGPNGMMGTDHAPRFCVRFGPGGGDPATRLRHAAEALPRFAERLRRMTILNRDAFAVLDSIADKPGVAVYVDSPYTRETRVAGAYTHDFADHGGATMFGAEDDHDRLAAALRRFEHARVVVSYEDCERVRDLYRGWDVVEVHQHKNTGNASGGAGGGSKTTAPEVLLVNNGARPEGVV